MNKLPMLGALVVPAVLLGCANAPVMKTEADARPVCDKALMGQVERAAWQHGATVVWVHCPLVARRAT